MALLKIRTPAPELSRRWSEEELPKRYGLEKVPFGQYVPGPRAAELLKKSLGSLKSFLINSPQVHGVEIGDTLYVHPHTILKRLIARKRKEIRDAIKAFSPQSPKTETKETSPHLSDPPQRSHTEEIAPLGVPVPRRSEEP